MEKKIDKQVEEQVIAYVQKNYPKVFNGVTPFIEEKESIFLVASHKDGSPMVLSKGILN